jgi:hypothetical protein
VNAPDASGLPRGKHVQSCVTTARIQPTRAFTPHQPAQVTQTVGVNPDPPDVRQASVPADTSLPVVVGSPTGFTPFMNQY